MASFTDQVHWWIGYHERNDRLTLEEQRRMDELEASIRRWNVRVELIIAEREADDDCT